MMGNNSPMPVCILWHPTGHTQDWFPDGKTVCMFHVCHPLRPLTNEAAPTLLPYVQVSVCLSPNASAVQCSTLHQNISHAGSAVFDMKCSEAVRYRSSSSIQNPDPIWCIELPPFTFLLAAGWHRHIADILHVELPLKLLNNIRHLQFCKYILVEEIVVKALLSSS